MADTRLPRPSTSVPVPHADRTAVAGGGSSQAVRLRSAPYSAAERQRGRPMPSAFPQRAASVHRHVSPGALRRASRSGSAVPQARTRSIGIPRASHLKSDDDRDLVLRLRVLEEESRMFEASSRETRQRNSAQIRQLHAEVIQMRKMLMSVAPGIAASVEVELGATVPAHGDVGGRCSRARSTGQRNRKRRKAGREQVASILNVELKGVNEAIYTKTRRLNRLRHVVAMKKHELQLQKDKLRGAVSSIQSSLSPMCQAGTNAVALRIMKLEKQLDDAFAKQRKAELIGGQYDQIVKELQHEQVRFDSNIASLRAEVERVAGEYENLLSLCRETQKARDDVKQRVYAQNASFEARRKVQDQSLIDRRAFAQRKLQETLQLEEGERQLLRTIEEEEMRLNVLQEGRVALAARRASNARVNLLQLLTTTPENGERFGGAGGGAPPASTDAEVVAEGDIIRGADDNAAGVPLNAQSSDRDPVPVPGSIVPHPVTPRQSAAGVELVPRPPDMPTRRASAWSLLGVSESEEQRMLRLQKVFVEIQRATGIDDLQGLVDFYEEVKVAREKLKQTCDATVRRRDALRAEVARLEEQVAAHVYCGSGLPTSTAAVAQDLSNHVEQTEQRVHGMRTEMAKFVALMGRIGSGLTYLAEMLSVFRPEIEIRVPFVLTNVPQATSTEPIGVGSDPRAFLLPGVTVPPPPAAAQPPTVPALDAATQEALELLEMKILTLADDVARGYASPRPNWSLSQDSSLTSNVSRSLFGEHANARAAPHTALVYVRGYNNRGVLPPSHSTDVAHRKPSQGVTDGHAARGGDGGGSGTHSSSSSEADPWGAGDEAEVGRQAGPPNAAVVASDSGSDSESIASSEASVGSPQPSSLSWRQASDPNTPRHVQPGTPARRRSTATYIRETGAKTSGAAIAFIGSASARAKSHLKRMNLDERAETQQRRKDRKRLAAMALSGPQEEVLSRRQVKRMSETLAIREERKRLLEQQKPP